MKALSLIKKNARTVLIIVAVLVLLFALWKNWDKVSRSFRRDRGRGDQQAGLNDDRMAELETLARRLYADIYSSWWVARDVDAYRITVQLNDNELEYLARFYENTLASGTPLGRDIESEIYGSTLSGEDDRIIARLRTLALY